MWQLKTSVCSYLVIRDDKPSSLHVTDVKKTINSDSSLKAGSSLLVRLHLGIFNLFLFTFVF